MASYEFAQMTDDVFALFRYLQAALPAVTNAACCASDAAGALTTVDAGTPLTPDQQAQLSALMAAYTNPPLQPAYRVVPTGLANVQVDARSWKTVWSCAYDGLTLPLSSASLTLSASPSEPSDATFGGSARVVDVGGNRVVASVSFSGATPAPHSLDLTSLGAQRTLLDIQAQCTGSSAYVTLASASLFAPV